MKTLTKAGRAWWHACLRLTLRPLRFPQPRLLVPLGAARPMARSALRAWLEQQQART